MSFAESLDGVRQVNKSDVVANTLSSVNMLVAYVSIAIIAILFGVSIFLISNTVTMGITVRREEIAIMKYIGAKGLCRAVSVRDRRYHHRYFRSADPACAACMYSMTRRYSSSWRKFSILQNIIDFLPVWSVYRYLLPIGLAMGIGIGFLGSFFTVRKHLKV